MKKTTSLKLSKQLSKYGAMAVAIGGVADAAGQIVYTDVTPDFAGGISTNFLLDLDNNGTNDFEVFHDADDYLYFRPLGDANNEVLGSIGYSSSYYGYFYGYAYPFALAEDTVISNSAAGSWNNFGFSEGNNSLNFNACDDGFWCDITDGYLGLRFRIGANTHYGWARLDVDTNGDVWIVKDYAYNTIPDEAILAGQQTLGLNTNPLADDVKIVSKDQSIALYNLPEQTNYKLFSLTGQSVLNGNINQNTYVIEAKTIASGIYILELTNITTNAILRKKIAL